MATQLHAVRDASQTERAVLGIRELILRGAFEAGERLSEVELAARLNVSRTPVRAALQRLDEEGLLEATMPTGYLVRSFTASDIADAIEVRGTIEGLAARLAAERGVSGLMLGEMRTCLQQIDLILAHEKDWDEPLFIQYGACNTRFHALLLEASGSDTVKRALSRVISLPFSSPNAFVLAQARIPDSFAILKIAQSQHHNIVDAIEARSGSRAESLAREHARIAHKNLALALLNAEALQQVVGAPLIRQG
jgi:GntR family transcriptional regulator of vanillate catabolism